MLNKLGLSTFCNKNKHFVFRTKMAFNVVLQLTWNKWVQSVEAEQTISDVFFLTLQHTQPSVRTTRKNASAHVCVMEHIEKGERKKNKLLSNAALNKRSSSCSELSASCWGSGGSGLVGGRGQVVQKMNTVSFFFRVRPDPLELIVPSQSFAEVGHLAADKQVVLFQNFLFGQMAVLMGDTQRTL